MNNESQIMKNKKNHEPRMRNDETKTNHMNQE